MPKKLYDWNTADKETRKLWVRVLREDEHSDAVIADFFGVTKGSIVGFRHRYLPDLSFGKKATRPRVELERFRDLLELAAMRTLEHENGNILAMGPVTSDAAPVSDSQEMPAESHPSLPQLCQWPMPGKSLKVPGICGARVTTLGEKLCDTHLAELKKSR